MSVRNLDALFQPTSIALIGASNRPSSIGAMLARNLLESGFAGPVLPINPHERSIRSALAYASVADLPCGPDLAVIATPPQTIPGLIGEVARRGCRAAVVISAGVTPDLRQQMLEAARPTLLRIVGPNCLGLIAPATGVNASFSHLTPKAGGVALVAQSGAITTAALDWAAARGIGFSCVATLGATADVDFGDMLDYLALDEATKAILLYVESIVDARKFMSAGRLAARSKPVVVIKGGRSAGGVKAAFSHTGALAGADAVYDAAFRRAGMLRVDDIRDLFDAVALLTTSPRIGGERLAIITNGGGVGVLAVDAMEAYQLAPASLAPATLAQLDAALPRTWSRGDPVDLIGDAGPERYSAATVAVLEDPGVDAILVMNCPTAVADSAKAADGVIEGVRRAEAAKPVLTAWLGEATAVLSRRRLAAAGLAVHETPNEAVRAFGHLVQHRRNQQMVLETPPAEPAPKDGAEARRIIGIALKEGRSQLTEPEAKAILAAYGVPVVESRVVRGVHDVAETCSGLAPPYALKVLSPQLSHKSDVGGVALNLPDSAAVAAELTRMAARITERAPNACIDGFILQSMITRPHARELICGIVADATFGPVVLFGEGGVAVEVRADSAIGLPPLNRVLARDLIGRTKVARLLAPYRNLPGADVEAVAQVLERLSQLAQDHPQITELDINPLLADEAGVLALDARIRVSPAVVKRPAIRPYPNDLVETLALPDGEILALRPVRPADASALIAMVEATSPEDRRNRFHSAMGHLPVHLAARLSQIDYERQMAFAAVTAAGDIVGIARLDADPDNVAAEFALLVRTDWHHRRLGTLLMRRLEAYARGRGLRRIWGLVLRDNVQMLALMEALGFVRSAGDGTTVTVIRALPATDAADVHVDEVVGGIRVVPDAAASQS
jgi:acetyltransferase